MTGHGPWPLISVERVLELHDAAIEVKGGMPGVRDHGLVESAVANARNASLYALNEEEDPVVIAAYLLYYLALNHAFLDGNKRVAWMAAEEQLRLAGVRVVAPTDDAEQLVLGVVAKRFEPRDVYDWLIAHLTGYYPEASEG
ncbi:MAG: type II toxin-antitoxin system death-on-curing family toxin [Byssovorax sp.]